MTCHYITSSYHFGIQIQPLYAILAYLACCHPVCQFGQSVKVKETHEVLTAGSPHLRFLYSSSDYVQQSQFAQRILLPKCISHASILQLVIEVGVATAFTPGLYRIHYIWALHHICSNFRSTELYKCLSILPDMDISEDTFQRGESCTFT